MKNHLITFSSFVKDAMGKCTCSKLLACDENSKINNKEWLEQNGCCHHTNSSTDVCKYLRAINNYNKIYNVKLDKMKLTDTEFYKDYLAHFDLRGADFNVPEEYKNDFDWDLLYRLVLGSFSCDYSSDALYQSFSGKKPELILIVQSGDKKVEEKLSDLLGFQIKRLHEIFFEEMIGLSVLLKDDDELNTVKREREIRLKKWGPIRETIVYQEAFYNEFNNV